MSSIEYRCFEGQPDAELMDWLAHINQELFAFGETAEHLATFFQSHQRILICMAFQGGLPVGFKVGVEDAPRSFESWRGGVLETARRQGIAMELQRLQHSWCEENEFRVIKTTTNSSNIPMLILNLRSGFQIVGSFVNRRKHLKVLQEKWLVPSQAPS
ncbi:MAG: GNAT family N-acetyltransferase [Deltaproteobacteria bacterium]|nr:GNAT family N-acetyltransferase [Deltaproteobacteria bacterium]